MPVWHLKSSNSKLLSWNEKSWGKRLLLRFTARTRAPVSTPYSSARSPSSMTFSPGSKQIRLAMRSTGIMLSALVMIWIVHRDIVLSRRGLSPFVGLIVGSSLKQRNLTNDFDGLPDAGILGTVVQESE